MLKFGFRSFLSLILLLAFAAVTVAQTGTSNINGTVKDINGAIVPGATVTARNEATGVVQTQTTTAAGVYAFPSLPVGLYTITVEKPGFKRFQSTGNALEVNTPLTVDVTLEAGQVSETVTVQAGIETLQTSNATIGNVVEQKAIEKLPLNGRNPLTLLLEEPGVVQRSANAAGSGVHVNGSRDRAFNVTIDGIEANESSVPNPVANLYRLTPDNVQEFKVTTNNATAEEGRNSGAAISVATRSGGNEFHGTAFEFLRNDAFNSNEFFNNARGIAKPVIKLNQFGGEVGGPVKRDKTFFFGSFQKNIINFTQPIDQSLGSVPLIYTPTALTGVFRYVVGSITVGNTTVTRNSPLLVDPKTGNLAPGVRACASATDTNCVQSYNIFGRGATLDPVVASILKTYPSPNTYAFGDGLNTAAYLWNPPTQVRGPAIMARIDHNFNESNSLFGRYLFSDYNTLKGDPLNARPQIFPGQPPLGEVFRRTSGLAIGYRRVISPRLVNELTMGYARFNFLFTQGEANPAFPNVPPFSFDTIVIHYNNTPRTQRVITTPQVLDNLSFLRGAHTFRTGFNFRFYRHVDRRGQPGGVNLTPTVTFSSNTRSLLGTTQFPTPPGISSTDSTFLASTINNLTGNAVRITQTFIANLNTDTYLPFNSNGGVTLFAEKHVLNQFNFYAQDEWKARPNLTINYGVRWEINPAPYTAGGNTYVPSSPITASSNVTFVKADRWYPRNNAGAIGPRIGFAYSPFKDGKTVVRAGYGIAFDTISSFQVTAVAGRVPGLTTACTLTVGVGITPGCPLPPNISAANNFGAGVTLGNGFPTSLPPPTVKPSSFLTPPAQTLSNAPPLITFAPDLKMPTVHEWSLSVQRELPWGFVGQAAYIGRRGTRLFRAYDINEIVADPILPSFLLMQQNLAKGCKPDGTGCPAGVTGATVPLVAQIAADPKVSASALNTLINGATTINDLRTNGAGNFAGRIEQTTLVLRLRPNQQFSTITYLDSGGDSYYHAAQFTLRRSFRSGLGLNFGYTYGKSIDDQSVDPVGAASGGGLSTTNSRTPIDIRNWRIERGRSDFDRRHAVTVASVYELPVGRGKRFFGSSGGLADLLLGGWTVNGIYTFYTGEPFSVTSGIRTSNFSHISRADVIAPVKAQLQDAPGVVGPVVFADTSAFAIPAPGQNGAGRNIFTAPNYWNLDLGFIKNVHLTERFNIDLRMEMFNALNHANFDNPRDASAGSPNIQSSVFGQTCCATVAPPATQTVVQTGESARVIQFAVKLKF
jgi:hypothetical protein